MADSEESATLADERDPYFTDLDVLLWEEHSRRMGDDELVNFMEEEVETEFSEATERVTTDVAP